MICVPELRFNAQQVLNMFGLKKNATHSKGNIIHLNLKHLKKCIYTSKIQKAVLNFYCFETTWKWSKSFETRNRFK